MTSSPLIEPTAKTAKTAKTAPFTLLSVTQIMEGAIETIKDLKMDLIHCNATGRPVARLLENQLSDSLRLMLKIKHPKNSEELIELWEQHFYIAAFQRNHSAIIGYSLKEKSLAALTKIKDQQGLQELLAFYLIRFIARPINSLDQVIAHNKLLLELWLSIDSIKIADLAGLVQGLAVLDVKYGITEIASQPVWKSKANSLKLQVFQAIEDGATQALINAIWEFFEVVRAAKLKDNCLPDAINYHNDYVSYDIAKEIDRTWTKADSENFRWNNALNKEAEAKTKQAKAKPTEIFKHKNGKLALNLSAKNGDISKMKNLMKEAMKEAMKAAMQKAVQKAAQNAAANKKDVM